MKPALLFLSISLILSCYINAQTIEQDIASIRDTYTRINAQQLKPEKFTYEAEGCVEEGTVTYFRNAGVTLKITESGSIGDGGWRNEYYYQSGKLVFCLETITGGPASGKATTTQYRYYFKDDKCIRFMEDKKIITETSTKISEALQRGYSYLQAYEKKNFAEIACN